MRALETITQIFDRCAAARAKASLVLCIAAFIFSPLTVHAETASLQYDNNGNIIQRTTPQGTTTYTYDPLNRLKSEAGPAKTQSFSYDENGNRLSDGAGNYTYEPTSNRMSTRLGLAVTFDAAGNMTADGTGRTFTYNQANQMYQVFQGGVLLATYEYDADGLRLSKTTTASAPQGAQTVVYFYGLRGHLLAETSGTGAPIRTYAWRVDTPVAQIEHSSGTDKILYFDPDHLNTPRAAMDETGKVVWRWESDAFGSTAPNEDVDGDGNLTTINMRFGGYYADVESGLFYAMHRYYNPATGQFTQADRLDLLRQAASPIYAQYSEPTDLQRALNQPFNYTSNNPLRYTDPTGLFEIHGNWCGPDWTGRRKHPYRPAPQGYYLPPTDYTDAACERHDQCFAMCREMNKCDKSARRSCMASCNQSLADAQRFGASSGTSIARSTLIWGGMQFPPDPGDNDPSCDNCEKK